jgi:RND family efflux transporter MFP subunit
MTMRGVLRWAGAGAWLAAAACQPEARAAETDAEAAVPVRVQPAAVVERPAQVRASGVVQARTTVDVAFQLPGKVVRVGPDEGEEVSAGQLLAQLDPTEYALGVQQAAAAAERAAAERSRYEPLLGAGSVAPNEYERMVSTARQSAAAAGLARKRLADTRLEAPISGVVARRAVEPGATVAPGAPVFTLVDLDPVRVRVGVPEADVGTVAVGEAATVTVPALPGQSFAGRVRLVGVAADPATRTYTVEVEVPNPGRVLRAGMVAEAAVVKQARARAVTVPLQAVVRDADDATLVYLLDARTGRVHARRVQVGGVQGAEVEVLDGLSGGEPVVVAGQHRVREGSRVAVAAGAGGVR